MSLSFALPALQEASHHESVLDPTSQSIRLIRERAESRCGLDDCWLKLASIV